MIFKAKLRSTVFWALPLLVLAVSAVSFKAMARHASVELQQPLVIVSVFSLAGFVFACVAWTIYWTIKDHPLANKGYGTWLRTTPWQYGQPLPIGSPLWDVPRLVLFGVALAVVATENVGVSIAAGLASAIVYGGCALWASAKPDYVLRVAIVAVAILIAPAVVRSVQLETYHPSLFVVLILLMALSQLLMRRSLRCINQPKEYPHLAKENFDISKNSIASGMSSFASIDAAPSRAVEYSMLFIVAFACLVMSLTFAIVSPREAPERIITSVLTIVIVIWRIVMFMVDTRRGLNYGLGLSPIRRFVSRKWVRSSDLIFLAPLIIILVGVFAQWLHPGDSSTHWTFRVVWTVGFTSAIVILHVFMPPDRREFWLTLSSSIGSSKKDPQDLKPQQSFANRPIRI
jgi:hypothetical protein